MVRQPQNICREAEGYPLKGFVYCFFFIIILCTFTYVWMKIWTIIYIFLYLILYYHYVNLVEYMYCLCHLSNGEVLYMANQLFIRRVWHSIEMNILGRTIPIRIAAKTHADTQMVHKKKTSQEILTDWYGVSCIYFVIGKRMGFGVQEISMGLYLNKVGSYQGRRSTPGSSTRWFAWYTEFNIPKHIWCLQTWKQCKMLIEIIDILCTVKRCI